MLTVWLPLLGNTNNQGLSNQAFAVSNTSYITVDNNGKLGKCYNFNSSANNTGIFSADDGFMTNYINNKSWSLCAWVNTTATDTCVMSLTYGLRMFAGDSSHTYISLYNSTRTVTCSSSIATNDGKWHHLCATYDVTTNAIKFYVDGVNTGNNTYTSGYTYASSWVNGIYIGKDPNNSVVSDHYLFKGKMNDVRIYSGEALSQKQIKLLSQGLVAHYTLGDRYASENLIINGFGELGSENWASSSLISTTEIPSADSNIKASFYNGNYTGLIPLNPNHSYTISGYMKSSGATTGTTYPSIYPYDRDLKFIAYYNSASGFSTTWSTTLSQPLNTGDTVIHATDLSAWSTATNNYYYHVAIFGYKDSFGTIYDDFVYTADSPSFGTYSDKSNLNKTNNTITLKSAYTGAPRPAGTKICQATEGSTYYYPWGGVALSSVQDWVFKTATFTPKNDGRLKACRYIRWNTYNNCYIAGNKLVDNTDTDRTIYDCSGYNNHAVQWAYDTNGNIVNTLTTPRYSFATFVNSIVSTGSGAGQASGTRYIYGNCTLKAPDRLTVAFWDYPIKGYGNSTGQGQLSLTNNAIGNNAGSDYQNAPLNHRDSGFDVNGSAGTIHKRLAVTFTANEWHHYAVTYDGRYARMYKDGVETASVDMGSNVALGDMCGIVLGFSKAGGVWRNNQSKYSDFRLYTTCLSADDIKSLYQVGASIDKSGNMYAYEFNEV